MKVQLGKKNESSKDPPEDSIFYYSFVHENMHLLEYVEMSMKVQRMKKFFHLPRGPLEDLITHDPTMDSH